MADREPQDVTNYTSPGGFVFGLQGFTWGRQEPKSLTFFLNNTCMVCDQWGRPIKGASVDGKEVWFAPRPPIQDDPIPGHIIHNRAKVRLATHAEAIAALAYERIDWQTLTCAGFPQLPYAELKKIKVMPFWPFSPTHDPAPTAGVFCTCVRCSITDPSIRKDAMRLYAEGKEAREAEMRDVDEDIKKARG